MFRPCINLPEGKDRGQWLQEAKARTRAFSTTKQGDLPEFINEPARTRRSGRSSGQLIRSSSYPSPAAPAVPPQPGRRPPGG
jgi:hypothetical protein